MKTGIELIAAERERQINELLWSPERDASYLNAELERAALCYIDVASSQVIVGGKGETYGPPDEWPWDVAWWKPSDDPLRNMAKAGALIAAAMDKCIRQNGEPQDHANARLIAAAPDMVAALIKMHEAGKDGGVHEGDWYMCLLSETITKALGPDWHNARAMPPGANEKPLP